MLNRLKRSSCALLLVTCAQAQSGVRLKAGNDSAQAAHTKQQTIRQRGTKALESEQDRSKAYLCANAETGGNAAIGACLVAEGKTTEHDYLAYARSIGALLRLVLPETSRHKTAIERVPFDAGEDAWRNYRDQSCTSMATQWEGGDQASVAYANCRLTLTWNHMNELAKLYSDLWH